MKKILIVGATSAIAEATARRWAAQGDTLFLAGRNLERLELIAKDLKLRGASETQVYRLDAAQLDTHADLITSALDSLGEIDIVLIAHGSLPDQAACEQNLDLTLQELNTNGISVISLLSLLAPRFELQKKGTIAVISSVAGDRGRASNYVYGTAKAAVSTFCEGLRGRLFKSGVQLIDIKPGFVDTPMTQGLDLPAPLVVSPDYVAGKIVRAIERKRTELYVPAVWLLIMSIIKLIPNMIFRRLKF